MAITRITVVWSGFRGAPGYSNFYFGGSAEDTATIDNLADAVEQLLLDIRSHLPLGLSLAFDPVANVIDEASGNITAQIDYDAPPPITGTGGGSYSAASGAVVNWNTTAYRNGRRVRGRTFFVPLSSAAYDEQGDLDADVLTDFRAATSAFIGGISLLPVVVWSRPTAGAGGEAYPVTSATVPDLAAVLRSRRD